MAAAPIGENYSGPVLFEGAAAPQLLAEVLGRNLHIGRKGVVGRKCRVDSGVTEELAVAAPLDSPATETVLLESLAIAREASVAFPARLWLRVVGHDIRIGAHACEVVSILFAPGSKDQSFAFDHVSYRPATPRARRLRA